jgi:hypothetical protein
MTLIFYEVLAIIGKEKEKKKRKRNGEIKANLPMKAEACSFVIRDSDPNQPIRFL